MAETFQLLSDDDRNTEEKENSNILFVLQRRPINIESTSPSGIVSLDEFELDTVVSSKPSTERSLLKSSEKKEEKERTGYLYKKNRTNSWNRYYFHWAPERLELCYFSSKEVCSLLRNC
jgi:hypothetical protein